MLTPGDVSDTKAALALFDRAGPMRYLLGEKCCDADGPRRSPRNTAAKAVMIGRSNRKRTVHYNQTR